MDNIVIPGLPAEYALIANTVIGLVAALLVKPLTAIAKKMGRTEGPTTVAISGVLALLVGVTYAAVNAASGGTFSVIQVIIVSLVAFAKSNGDYISDKQASKKVVVTNPQPLPTIDNDTLGRPATPEDFAPSMKIE